MNRFRCQYQKGTTYVSETCDNEEPISSSQILISLAILAKKVKDKVDWKTGGRVALQVLKIHEYIIKNLHNCNNVSNGPFKSFYLNKKSKKDKDERIDIEFYGSYGKADNTSRINKYITLYRAYKNWR